MSAPGYGLRAAAVLTEFMHETPSCHECGAPATRSSRSAGLRGGVTILCDQHSDPIRHSDIRHAARTRRALALIAEANERPSCHSLPTAKAVGR